MYSEQEKKFRCNNCKKVVEPGEDCWTKWNLPPSHLRSQTMPSLVLQYENAPIICSECAKIDIKFSDF